jgi:hypothetical protein
MRRLVRTVVLSLTCCVLAAPGVAVAAQHPPRHVPACFASGSGYFTCQGEIIPGGGTVQTLTTPDAGNAFSLSGPAPLQSTKPVACGDAGCVYNHLDWYLGSGVSRKTGCGENQTSCVVTVTPGAATWAVVYVRQNNDPKTLWALWRKGGPDVTLSGTVRKHECEKDSSPCALTVGPADGVGVTLQGPHGTKETTTNNDGTYSFTVEKGTYTIRVPGSSGGVKPSSRSVDAHSDVEGLDFTVCKSPSGYHGTKPACDLVALSGYVLDISGAAYDHAIVSVPGDITQANSLGQYELFTPPGSVLVTADDVYAAADATGSVQADAAGDDSTAPDLTIQPGLHISQAFASEVAVQFAGLPVGTASTDSFAVLRTGPFQGGQCDYKQTSPLIQSKGRNAYVAMVPKGFGAFCSGPYTGTLLDGSGAVIKSVTFAIP